MSGPTTDKTGQIQKREPNKGDTLAELVRAMLPEIKRALPAHINPERMLRIAVTAIRQTPDLALCTPASFLGCVMQCAQLGLEPNTPLGLAWLIPRKSKKLNDPKLRECTLIIGYQGLLELSRRSGLVGPVYAHVVREGDDFEYGLGTDTYIKHRPSDDPEREDKPITHVYCVAKERADGMKAGLVGFQFIVLTRAQVEARRKRSAAADDGPWITDYEAMCLKTSARALSKWLPKSAEMARAEAIEDAMDRGASITTALDPVVAEAMTKGGLIDDAEIVDPVTGEVKPAQNGSNGNGESKAS